MSRWIRLAALVIVCSALTGCEAPQVYGSVGVSSWGGYNSSGPRMNGSISIGGRIY